MKATSLASFLAFALVLAAAARGPDDSIVLDRVAAPYLEDDGSGRVLAHLQASLRRHGGRTALELQIDAVDPSVDPVPGFAGIAGANRRTAHELQSLVATGALAVITRHEHGGSVAGSYRIARQGAIPERRLRDDGSLDVSAFSPERFVLALHVESGALETTGRHETHVLVGGVSRLRVTFDVAPEGGRILEVTSLPERDSVSTPPGTQP